MLTVIGLIAGLMAKGTEKINKSLSSAIFIENRADADDDETFGETLKDFGYKFNEAGELRNIKTGERFNFEIKKDDRSYNQKNYEALGNVITEEIYNLLESEGGLKRIKTPFDARKNEAAGFFFASPDYLTNERLLILIHGSGAVRAGQWARRLIINDNLKTGTQLPYVKKAKEAGFAVVVMNTNQNKMYDDKGKVHYIRENEDPVSHAFHVWDHFIMPSNAKHVAIVAHSAGGYVTVKLALDKSKEFSERVFAVAFTDSAHSSSGGSSAGWKHLLKVGQNWVTSRQPLDDPVQQYRDEISRISAGTTSHEETSSKAIDSICAYIKDRLMQITKKQPVISKEAAEEQASDDDAQVVENFVQDAKDAEPTVKIDEQVEDKADLENIENEQIESGANFAEPSKNSVETPSQVEPSKIIVAVENKKKKFESVADAVQTDGDEEPKVKREKIEL